MPQDIFHITSAGSVDDGKSTILARLLLDTGSVFEDQLGGIDPSTVDATTIADLLDGLESEREQGITIDVAHRFFDSDTRRYHIADSPGHEQYTRNMATAASHADALLLVLEAPSGVKPQTLRHMKIAALLGIRHVVVAINKMDLVRHSQKTFAKREAEILTHLSQHEFTTSAVIPVSGLTGVNIVKRGRQMAWWTGPTLLQALDGLNLDTPSQGDPVCVIQDVRRIPGGGRRYLASLISGEISTRTSLVKAGHHVSVAVTALHGSGSEALDISAPTEISLELDGDIDLERGDVLASAGRISLTDHLEGNLVWLNSQPGHPGRRVEFRLGHASVKATVTRAWSLNDSLSEKSGEIGDIPENSITRVTIELSQSVAFTPFSDLAELGRFVLVDYLTGDTLAAGTIIHGLRRSENIIPHDFTLDTKDFEELTGVKGRVAWFTGLSGSGKSTIANEVSQELRRMKIPHGILDGDTLRKGLTKDLGFSEADRIENIRRTAEVAKLMADSGLFVLVSLISPYLADRENAKAIVGPERFIEVFVDTPLEVCESRDPKGLYQKARAGHLPQFTGIDAPYEKSETPDVTLDGQANLKALAKSVLAVLQASVPQG
jgi:bifunctional enzyme CysN/CysC